MNFLRRGIQYFLEESRLPSGEPAARYGTRTVGAFGIIGVTGALIAPFAGRLTDRLGARVMNGAALAMMALSSAAMGASGASFVVLALGVVLLDAGEQSGHISNQARIFALDPALRNRLNAVYMVAFFIGGAAGSLIAGYTFQHAGWIAVCAAGFLLAIGGIAAVNYHRGP